MGKPSKVYYIDKIGGSGVYQVGGGLMTRLENVIGRVGILRQRGATKCDVYEGVVTWRKMTAEETGDPGVE